MPLRGPVHPHHPGVGSRGQDGVRHHHVVVLRPDPGPSAQVGSAHEREQRLGGIDRGGGAQRRWRRRGNPGAVVLRRGARERLQRQVGHGLAVQAHDEAVLGDGLADHGEVEVPFLEHGPGFGLLLGTEHHQHPLLAFGEHHLVGGHPRLAHRDAVEVEPDPEIPLVAHLHRRAGEAGGAHVLDRDDRAGCHELQARLHQPLLGEGIAHLHRRPLLLDRGVELGGGHGRAAHPVAPGLRAEIDHRHADPAGGGVEDRIGAWRDRRQRR